MNRSGLLQHITFKMKWLKFVWIKSLKIIWYSGTFVFIRRFVCRLVARCSFTVNFIVCIQNSCSFFLLYYFRFGFAIALCLFLIKCICWSVWHHTSEYDMKFYALVKFILCHVYRYGTVAAKGLNNNEHQCLTIGLLLTSWFKCRNSILMMKEFNVCQFNCQWNFSLLVYLQTSDSIDWLRFAEFVPCLSFILYVIKTGPNE